MNDPTIQKQLNQFPRPPPSNVFAPGVPTNGWKTNETSTYGTTPMNLARPKTVFNRSQDLHVPRQVDNPYR